LKLFILGATGGTGLELVRQAPGRGHVVTAYGRSEAPAPAVNVKGDVLDTHALAGAMTGHDAVVFTLGPRSLGPTTLYTSAMSATLPAMRESGLRRLVVVSLAILFPGVMGPIGRIGRWFLRYGADDAEAMERQVTTTDLDWTVLRPPRLTNGAPTGRWRTEVDALPKGGWRIARADLATCNLELLEGHAHSKHLLGVCR
jgi:putative NADH-flavin reductase